MKGIVYRSAALALACIVALSVLAVPSFAGAYEGNDTFWNWLYKHDWFLGKAIIGYTAGSVCTQSDDSFHHANEYEKDFNNGYYKCVCIYCGQTFEAHDSDLDAAYSTIGISPVVNSKGLYDGMTYYAPFIFDGVVPESNNLTVTVLNSSQLSWSNSSSNTDSKWITISGWFELPFSMTSSWKHLPCSHECSVGSGSGYSYTEYYYYDSGDWIPITNSSSMAFPAGKIRVVSKVYPCQKSNCSSGILTVRPQFLNVTWGADLPSTNVDYDIQYRPTSFSPSFSYEDENGQETVSDQQIIDEQGLNYYNPVTNTTTNITDWTYDYSDRSYTCTTENNTTTTITYGDEFITINEGDVNNTYITYNIYYYTAPENSGDGSGSGSDGEGSGSGGSGDNSDDGDGIGGGLGELLGSLLGGLIDLITGLISGLIDSLINLVDMTIEKLGQVVNLFGEFGDALKVLWSWLPDEVVTILAAGVSVVVFASVIKLFV